MQSADLRIDDAPATPGVYLFKGFKERVLYVGKAKNLRNRLRSYTQDLSRTDPRKAAMMRQVRHYSFVITENELEALVLEASLIKHHKPPFNIILRDDKHYPFIKLTTGDTWPRIEVVRRIGSGDGNLYFGPYVPAQGMWEALTFIRRHMPLRTCKSSLDKTVRPCIRHQMKRCAAPCAGLVSREEYGKTVEEVRLFLDGDKGALLGKLEERMLDEADRLNFEEAAKIRDRIMKLRTAFESQRVIAPELGDMDVIGMHTEPGTVRTECAVQLLFIRNGVLIGTRDFFFQHALSSDETEILHGFIELFYSKHTVHPPVIILECIPDEADMLSALLEKTGGRCVEFRLPCTEKETEIVRMARENARIHCETKMNITPEPLLELLRDKLSLSKTPETIGALDVSTIQGSESVGAYVFWERGTFVKDRYRRLRIRETEGIDDYAMMEEISRRILDRGENGLPDLLLVDGGKGQLEIVEKVRASLNADIDIVGVAKKPDRAFLRDGQFIGLDDRQGASLLIRKIRDEVHRFAVRYHRTLRNRRTLSSPLDAIPGIGHRRRLALLRHFGSIDAIRKASAEEIAGVPGIPAKLATTILSMLREELSPELEQTRVTGELIT